MAVWLQNTSSPPPSRVMGALCGALLRVPEIHCDLDVQPATGPE